MRLLPLSLTGSSSDEAPTLFICMRLRPLFRCDWCGLPGAAPLRPLRVLDGAGRCDAS
jgi:hypothetical protein